MLILSIDTSVFWSHGIPLCATPASIVLLQVTLLPLLWCYLIISLYHDINFDLGFGSQRQSISGMTRKAIFSLSCACMFSLFFFIINLLQGIWRYIRENNLYIDLTLLTNYKLIFINFIIVTLKFVFTKLLVNSVEHSVLSIHSA